MHSENNLINIFCINKSIFFVILHKFCILQKNFLFVIILLVMIAAKLNILREEIYNL